MLLDADHALHHAARSLLEREVLIVPSSILGEVDYLANARLGAQTARAFLEDTVTGAYDFVQVELEDMRRALALMQQYRDAHIGFVDASIVALAERYRLRRILTLDSRHFSLFRPAGLGHLELLP